MMQLDDPFMRARLELIDTQFAGLGKIAVPRTAPFGVPHDRVGQMPP